MWLFVLHLNALDRVIDDLCVGKRHLQGFFPFLLLLMRDADDRAGIVCKRAIITGQGLIPTEAFVYRFMEMPYMPNACCFGDQSTQDGDGRTGIDGGDIIAFYIIRQLSCRTDIIEQHEIGTQSASSGRSVFQG